MEKKSRNTEIEINSIFDPNSTYAIEYAKDLAEVYRERITDEEYLSSILMNPEVDGARKLVIEANDKESYLISSLDFVRRITPDIYPGRMDLLREIANHSIFLMRDSDQEKSTVAWRFLNIYLYGRANRVIEENYGPDFSAFYNLMLTASAKTINNTVENLKNVPAVEHIGPAFEDRILAGIVGTFLVDQPKVTERHILNNFWKIREYVTNRPKRNPQDTPNLDIALIKFFLKNEEEIITSPIAENFNIDRLITFKIIGEDVLKLLSERDALTFEVDEDTGEITFDTIPNPQKVIPISWGRRRSKRSK